MKKTKIQTYVVATFILISNGTSIAQMNSNSPTVGGLGGDTCLETIKTNREVDLKKCFPSSDETDPFRWKIKVLINTNAISNEKFWNLVKDSTSLKEAYFRLALTYPINQTCQILEERHEQEVAQYESSAGHINCNTRTTDTPRSGAPVAR